MPGLLEAPPATDASAPLDPFADLIGGENGAPAYQTVGGRFGAVPKAEVNTPTDLGAFTDLLPDPVTTGARVAGGEDLGAFHDLVPQSPTAESEKALAETDYMRLEKGVSTLSGQPLHEVMNAVRVFGNSAGRYIFRGLEGATHSLGKMMAGDAPTVDEGAFSESPENQKRLEDSYHSDVADYFAQLPEKLRSRMGIDPALAKTAPARIADAAGPAVMASVEALVPGIGIPLMATHGALATEAEAKAAGASDDEAEAAGARSAIGLAIFGGASKVAALGVSKALPYLVGDAGKFTQFIAQFTGQETANETSSRAINAWEAASAAPPGRKIEAAVNALGDQTLEGGTFNVVYALMHAGQAAAARPNVTNLESRDPAIAERLAAERATSPASEPARESATTSGPAAETPQSVEPAREAVPENQTTDAMQPAKGGEPNAIQERSAETQIPRTAETGQNQPVQGEGVGRSEQRQEAAGAPAQEAGSIISPERELLSKLGGRRIEKGDGGFTEHPLVQFIQNDMGGIMSKSTATRGGLEAERFAANKSLWDDAPRFSDPRQNKVYNARGGEAPDVVAQAAADAGLLPPGADATTLWNELRKIGASTHRTAKAERAARGEEKALSQNPILGEHPDWSVPNEPGFIRRASEAMQEVVNDSRKMGLVPPGSTGVQGGIEHLAKVWRQIRDLPKFGDFKKAILGFGQRMQSSFLEAKEVQRTLKKNVPSRWAREGIFNYIEAAGDKATLTTWRDASPEGDLKRGYEAALNLTPEQIAIADHLRDFYSNKLAEGQRAGILAEGRENYVNRIVDKRRSKGFAPVAAGGSGVGPGSSGRLAKNFKHGLHRVFENSFDAERNGIRYKTKDVAELAPIYLNEMNKVIGTRNLLADLAHGTAEDGRALAFPKGSMATMTGKEGETTARLIKPNTKQMVLDEMTGKDVSAHDYATVDHPALNDWKWVGTDSEGKPILVQGNLALHPEIANHVKNLLGESALRKWYNSDGSPLASLPKALVRNIDKAQQVAKELLFSGSGFHHANIGFHAVEHRVNPLPEFFKSLSRDYTIDPASPHVQDWMQHSLQLAPDQLSARHFMEGFGGRAVEKIPLYGRIASAIADHLFERFIPALKLKLATSMLERNMKLYAGDIAANKVTPDQVKYLSAQQANSALSHINYIDIGRNPTMQHLLSLTTLAPDFSESRVRFLSQAGKTLLGSKAGVEQFVALAYGAGLIWSMARVLNKVADDDYHFEQPFGVVHNGRVYGIRSIQGDLAHMITDPRKFFYGRVSPLVKLGLEQFLTGTNYRGEKIGHIESLKEYLSNYVPISAKNIPGLRDLFETTKNNPVTPWESFMGAMGVQASRYSPISKTYQAAKDWKKANGIADDKGVYPVSKYQQLRYSLEDGDLDRARIEYKKLIDAGEKRTKISDGFRESILQPFTGSTATDLKFKKSLSGDERLTYDAAVKKRHEILRRYQFMRGSR